MVLNAIGATMSLFCQFRNDSAKEVHGDQAVLGIYGLLFKLLKISYHNSDTIVFSIYPHYGNLK